MFKNVIFLYTIHFQFNYALTNTKNSDFWLKDLESDIWLNFIKVSYFPKNDLSW